MTQEKCTEKLGTERFCWLTCLDIFQTTCTELLQQIATDVTEENAASQQYATACLGLALLQQQQRSWSTASRYTSTSHFVTELAAGDHTVANMLIAVVNANSATSMTQLSQSVQETEIHTAALERQVMQGQDSAVALHDTAPSSTWQQLSKKTAQQYMESVTGSMSRMTLQKKTEMQKGHSQRLRACWPLDVAPGHEQQVAAFAQVSRRMAPLQSYSGVGLGGRPTPSMRKLQLHSLLSPVNGAAASLEVQYWQMVAITVPDKLSPLGLPDTVSNQFSSQQAAVTALQASPSAAHLACGASSGTLVVTHVTTGTCWMGNASVPSLTITPEAAVAVLAWDHRNCHLLSMTLGKHLRVWALPTSDQAPPLPLTDAQSCILQLQLVFSTTLGPGKALQTPELRGATAMLHWHIQSAAFQVWLQTGDSDISGALHHPLVHADSVSPSGFASAPQTAADAMSTSQTHCYKGHQAEVRVLAFLQPSFLISVDRQGHILQWSLAPSAPDSACHAPLQKWTLPTHLPLFCPSHLALDGSPYQLTTAMSISPVQHASIGLTYRVYCFPKSFTYHDVRGPARQVYPAATLQAMQDASTQDRFLLGQRQWLVKHTLLPERNGQLIRQVLHASTSSQRHANMQGGPMLLSHYAAASSLLLTRHEQPSRLYQYVDQLKRPAYLQATFMAVHLLPNKRQRIAKQVVQRRCRLEVLAGRLLPGSAAHLLVVGSASTTVDEQSIVGPLHIFSCHVLRLRDSQPQGTRVDIWDSSNGQRAPVFAVSQACTALASAYLWFSHGSNQLGCYSLTTGQLVREVSVSSLQPQSVVSTMQLVGHQQHRSQLAIAVAGSDLISWIHVSNAAATEAVLASRFAAMHVEQADDVASTSADNTEGQSKYTGRSSSSSSHTLESSTSSSTLQSLSSSTDVSRTELLS